MEPNENAQGIQSLHINIFNTIEDYISNHLLGYFSYFTAAEAISHAEITEANERDEQHMEEEELEGEEQEEPDELPAEEEEMPEAQAAAEEAPEEEPPMLPEEMSEGGERNSEAGAISSDKSAGKLLRSRKRVEETEEATAGDKNNTEDDSKSAFAAIAILAVVLTAVLYLSYNKFFQVPVHGDKAN